MVGLAPWVALFRASFAAGKLLVSIHGLGGFRLDLLVVADISFLALALLLLLFLLGGRFSFKSGAGQKKLTEKPLLVDFAAHCALQSVRQLS
jgi:hypothetical protein